MSSQLRLNIHNFGIIKDANIELKKFNVVAGINDSGKSTLSKLLYCFLTANSKEQNYLSNKNIDMRIKRLFDELYYNNNIDLHTSKELLILYDQIPNISAPLYDNEINKIINKLKNIINSSQLKNKNKYITTLDDIKIALSTNKNVSDKYFSVANVLLNSEFNFYEFELKDDTKIQFHGNINGEKFYHEIISEEDNIGFKFDNTGLNYLDFNNVIYIDSFSIFELNNTPNTLRLENLPYHLRFLSRIINYQKNNDDIYDKKLNQKLDEIKKEIQHIIGGYFYFDDKNNEFIFKKQNKTFSMKNTALGIKQLGILQILLSNRMLNENSFLILDEPEVNLHSQWQVKLAKILVLLVKKLNIHVFINSHSSLFIEALEVYTTRYELKNDINFYLTKLDESSDKYIFKQISYPNLFELYDNLGNPYDIIDEIRGENIVNKLSGG